jgi:hypothetical protein
MTVLKPEVNYVFNYEGFTKKVTAYVDTVTNTRVMEYTDIRYSQNTYYTQFSQSLNYKGSGATELLDLEAELAKEEIVFGHANAKFAKLLYRLPDVDAYVVVDYYYDSGQSEIPMPPKAEFKEFRFILKSV